MLTNEEHLEQSSEEIQYEDEYHIDREHIIQLFIEHYPNYQASESSLMKVLWEIEEHTDEPMEYADSISMCKRYHYFYNLLVLMESFRIFMNNYHPEGWASYVIKLGEATNLFEVVDRGLYETFTEYSVDTHYMGMKEAYQKWEEHYEMDEQEIEHIEQFIKMRSVLVILEMATDLYVTELMLEGSQPPSLIMQVDIRDISEQVQELMGEYQHVEELAYAMSTRLPELLETKQ